MMRYYKTKVTFNGVPATVGRIVCVKYRGDILAGVVVAISCDQKRPIIRALSHEAPDGRRDTAWGHFGTRNDLPFHHVERESDILTAPETCWFWPPRV